MNYKCLAFSIGNNKNTSQLHNDNDTLLVRTNLVLPCILKTLTTEYTPSETPVSFQSTTMCPWHDICPWTSIYQPKISKLIDTTESPPNKRHLGYLLSFQKTVLRVWTQNMHHSEYWLLKELGIIIVVIITWPSEKPSQKITLTPQLSGSLIGSNGLILCKILNMMSQLATWCRS